jgi:poly-gamma-glutamate synthesis protein (capsule biosynthesis protein)
MAPGAILGPSAFARSDERDMATIVLTGDVMLGRGIDQILAQPNSPELYESFVRSALTYVALAEARNGPIPRGVPCDYVWGDSLDELRAVDLSIINLETAMTCADQPAPKGINYRCHPANMDCITAAGVDCCVLANNHVLDWGEEGLIETLDSLRGAGLAYAGAGRSLEEAQALAVLPLPSGARALVYGLGAESSGVPPSWSAADRRAGVNFLDDYDSALEQLSARIAREKRAGDVAIVSIHWGPNWGYDIPEGDRRFARRLIDEARVDIVHGHSSHHPKAIEVHRGRPIFYGCGDFLNDYEGISGHEPYRPDLVLAYRVTLAADGSCRALELLPYRIANFRLNRATDEEAGWLGHMMGRECARFGGHVFTESGALRLAVPEQPPNKSPRRANAPRGSPMFA